ncbi:adhesin [Actinoplanes sp. SE50]|uniref:hypothetical protein n=1 Tax=unclassified Actinoplanes TaxID=2626549 RepID=UPI00023EDFF1|nr:MULTISPECIES: hypothetical protein [unclassified Actinoplanes]AEV88927.1 Aggregation substance [Actinoplanes sp. SE50/110]ATO87333.1 adhesin [Actinoplanes sp. SE50]SLM04751.1 adhesin [Actinoplanes sp. SE50/110]
MRTTVGPLSPAVYWRRRAVVLGALLLGIIVWFVACSHDDTKPDTKNAASSYPTPAPASATPKSSVSGKPGDSDNGLLASAPAGNPVYPDPVQSQGNNGDSGLLPANGGGQNGGGQNGSGQNTNVNQPAGNACADNEIQVTPVPAATSIKRGANLAITLRIRNVGNRTCTRDVGADPQELYVEAGAQKIWSSDKCSGVHGNDVQTFKPGDQREFNITWNGHQSTACNGATATGPAPAAGQYSLRGRLDGLVSQPVVLTLS